MSDVFVDGTLYGNIKDGNKFIKKLIESRRNGKLTKNANFHYSEKEDIVFIQFDKNRLRRPLIVIKDGKSLLTQKHIDDIISEKSSWLKLIEDGIIEEIDALEEEALLIAMDEEKLTKKHTHMEIDPIIIFGMNTTMIPFANHDPSTRLLRGQKNQMQGTSLYTTNYLNRLDTNVNVLHYTQKPIVKSYTHDLFGDHITGGQNVVIAILNYDGYNMSDGIVFNRASVDRGLCRVSHFRPYSTERLRYSAGQVDRIIIPDKEVQGYTLEEDYRYLDSDGLVNPETEVSGGDVLVGKTSPPRFLSKLESFSTAANIRKDTSSRVKFGENGVVSKVILTESQNGNPLINVEVRDTRPISIGDKVSSRHGQKGVVGYLANPEDMPFSSSGTVPDVIFNPFGMRRMTVSHLMESLGAKTGALNGRYIDGTPFSGEKTEDIRKELEEAGFRENGTETLYDGRTGKEYEAKIFVGNIYYLRLKHQVADKIQSRARGRVALLTRQPTAGKAMEGGLRFGDMEKDTLIAHGASLLLKERFDSDIDTVYVGDRTGDLAEYNPVSDKFESVLEPQENVSKIRIAYGFKLLLEQLKSMGIRPYVKLKSKFREVK
jgi:DNA-directed RNA polymerase beta subunit